MNNLINALLTNDQRTENGMKTHSTSGSYLLDLYASGGAMRKASEYDIMNVFNAAFQENPLGALKILFYIRDIRGGLGERAFFRTVMLNLINSNINDQRILDLLKLIPEYGRWDDLVYLYENISDDRICSYIVSMFKLALETKQSLCAKWLPRKGYTANRIRKELGWSPKQYRKTLVYLTNVVETSMCKKEWGNIKFENVPSVAMSRYTKAFAKNANIQFSKYLSDIKEGKKKINSSILYPYDIIRGVKNTTKKLEHDILNEQWNNLPIYGTFKDYRMLPVVDVSGSMMTPVAGSVQAIDISTGLGIYLAEKNEGPFKNYYMQFSEVPKLVHIIGNTISEKLDSINECDSYGYNTNVEATFKYLLEHAKANNIKNEEMPTHLLFISDMEFDQAKTDKNDNIMEMAQKYYKEHGYDLPILIFWNVYKRVKGNIQAKLKDNAILISGYSPSVLSNIEDAINPMTPVLKILDSTRYSSIKWDC